MEAKNLPKGRTLTTKKVEVDGDLNTASQLQTHLMEECYRLTLFKYKVIIIAVSYSLIVHDYDRKLRFRLCFIEKEWLSDHNSFRNEKNVKIKNVVRN